MKQPMYVVKELNLFKGKCDLENLMGFRQFKCYKTSKGEYIAILQMDNLYNLNLEKVRVIDKYNRTRVDNIELVPLRLDKKYKVYEIIF